jgi:hypothetical protein
MDPPGSEVPELGGEGRAAGGGRLLGGTRAGGLARGALGGLGGGLALGALGGLGGLGGGPRLGGKRLIRLSGGFACRADTPPPQPLTVTCSSMLPPAQSSPELR